MDALLLDQMLPEYEERRVEAANYVLSSDEITPSSSREEKYEAELGGLSTIPVADEATGDYEEKVTNLGSTSRNSTTSSLQETNSSIENASIYHPSATSPTINYEREYPQQKLVAVFGRQFDLPDEIACSLQKLVSVGVLSGPPSVKFVPFTMKRKALLKGNYDSAELLKHDLVCMCYNASEARLLLTGVDGFYTSLLRHTEAILGKSILGLRKHFYYSSFLRVMDTRIIP